jgi:hypothetical protein
MLIRNRDRPIAIAARAILRAGTGHKYWSSFAVEDQQKIEKISSEIFSLLFNPEIKDPIKTLDIPLGGATSPVDALSILVEFLLVANAGRTGVKTLAEYPAGKSGAATISAALHALGILKRMTGNTPGSLGLHPAVYFYNERGKHSRFLFLGMIDLLTRKLDSNDSGFFRKFSAGRQGMEKFLIENKSLVGVLLQNMAKSQRILKMADLFEYLVSASSSGASPTVEAAITRLGVRGRVYDLVGIQSASTFTDETKSGLFIKTAIATAPVCPICNGLLDATKSISCDHIKRVREGGTGDIQSAQMVHPYCNSAVKN